MALQQDGVFDEHLSVISALKDNFVRKDDANMVASILSVQQQIAQLCSSREDQVKQSIRELSSRVEEAAERATYPEAENAHEGRVGELAAAADEAKENVNKMNSELRYLQQQREALKDKFGELRQKSDQLEQLITDAEPRTRHQLSLYAHISKITWHFDKKALVAGTISHPASGDISKFELDPQEMSEFDVVNRLWAMMDGQ